MEAAIEYLELLDGDSRAQAVEYLRKAPASVDTLLRREAAAQAWYRG